MPKKTTSIPVNHFGGDADSSMLIDRICFKDLPDLAEWSHPERHDRHSFFLVEKGKVTIEIDFQRHEVRSGFVIYMHPDQVHRIIAFENVTVVAWGMSDENLSPEYLKLLEDLAPAMPLLLKKQMFTLISEAASLYIQFAAFKSNKLFHSLLKDSCNTLVGIIISQYLETAKSTDKPSRFEIVTKAFRTALERNYTTARRPADYAALLNISAPYLNECVKNITGISVSHHIQQRVILEAKRLLAHSNRSVKEIATELGYDDYPYFSRLFTKVAGVSALAFRNKNLD